MTSQEFSMPFQLLCRGLECEPTQEQVSAWYRRIGHITLVVWKNVVDTLLFDGRKGYLPKLEHVLEVVEKEAEWVRKATVERDKFTAKKTYTLLTSPVNHDATGDIPTPETPLFACIKAFAGRADVLRRLRVMPAAWPDARKTRERERLAGCLAQHERDIETYSPLITDADAARLVREYETPVSV